MIRKYHINWRRGEEDCARNERMNVKHRGSKVISHIGMNGGVNDARGRNRQKSITNYN